ncbi:hypothetical protein BDV12DRAFT_184475 [Aspergillus spectabilis]
MVSFGEERRRNWKLLLDATLNDFSSVSSVAPSIETDVISPVTQRSYTELSLEPRTQSTRTRSRSGSILSIIDAISPLEPDAPWTDSCWSDATTAGAVLSLLHKEPLGLPSEHAYDDEPNRRTTRITCSVCLETLEPEHYPGSPIAAGCDHTSISGTQICAICLSRSLDVQFSTSQDALLMCPLCHAHLSDEEVERWASTPTFATYDTARTLRAIEDDAEFVRCSKPDCGYGQLHAGGLEVPIVVCGACGARTCFIHRNIPWHEGLTCAQYEAIDHSNTVDGDRIRGLPAVLRTGRSTHVHSASEEFLSQMTIQETTRACPGCHVATEKSGGCKHMRCGMCRREWCWECGNDWERGHLGVDCAMSLYE